MKVFKNNEISFSFKICTCIFIDMEKRHYPFWPTSTHLFIIELIIKLEIKKYDFRTGKNKT